MPISFPKISEEQRIRRLLPPSGKVNMVLDTDTFNEIDDQFAIVYTLLSKDKIDLQAIYAAPFFNHLSKSAKDGMDKSYDEMIRILHKMNVPDEGFAFRGSESFLPSADRPVDSPAVRDLITRAMAAPDDEPLYVVAIGAITNVASAILLEPRIIEKIVVVWLGGHRLDWRHTKEFNLKQDVLAAQILFDCGVPLVLVPCTGVASHLLTTLPEVERYVKGKGAIGDFLAERYEACSSDHFGYSRVIWDISVIAWLVNPASVPTALVHSPILTDQVTWSHDTSRHLIRCADYVHRDAIFKDFFRKLEQYAITASQAAQ
ncbi:nucleoside hydrolase [Paenibacillus allorhizosphaerae]|uniref:Non-specific ribonucleoside hydrolase RihC n=1 Tax=Paenibacillus allorhizosphaerae TaxID=2849866 RepID=A0ABM8VDH4_9BACL|nr:nucleoside hydrolase [Paenibacillus allorhizosphaerae]CAG7627718.1 Non-specific ribonucleoside hydrolase RihC [Paenibacillus allorhizosphaerae]